MKQPIKVVILPTEDKHIVGNISKCIKSGVYAENEGDLVIIGTHTTIKENTDVWQAQYLYITVTQDVEPIKEGDWFIKLRDVYPTGLGALHQCKMVLGNELRTTDDWTLQIKYGNEEVLQKVIATTDPKLTIVKKYESKLNPKGYKEQKETLPQVPQQFLKEYVANPDGEYYVEYKTDWSKETKMQMEASLDDIEFGKPELKLNQDNEVTISLVEEKMYSREELVRTYNGGFTDGSRYDNPPFYQGDADNWIKENL